MSARVAEYMRLHHLMVAFDDGGAAALADSIRDEMDPLWYGANEREREAIRKALALRSTEGGEDRLRPNELP